MFKFLAILVLAFASANAFWTSCSSGPAPTSLTSAACSGTTCTITRGQMLQAVMVFPSTVAASVLDVAITAYPQAGGSVSIPVTPPHNDGLLKFGIGRLILNMSD
jgi:hypothetical protein